MLFTLSLCSLSLYFSRVLRRRGISCMLILSISRSYVGRDLRLTALLQVCQRFERKETTMASEDEKQDKGLSEYERFMAELTPVLEKFKVTDLTENDVEFLADKTETDWINIKLLILAHYYAALTGLPHKFFYGLLRTQSPSDPLALLTETSEKLRFGLLESIQDKI